MRLSFFGLYRFLVHPVVMGRGKRFFEEGMPATGLRLVESKALDLGGVRLGYELFPNLVFGQKTTTNWEINEGSAGEKDDNELGNKRRERRGEGRQRIGK